MNWEMYGVVIAALGLVFTMIRNFRKDTERHFNLINADFKGVHYDLTEIKERLSFLEAANIYTMPSEPSPPNNRSLAAIKMHQRRRNKADKKDG